MLTDREKTWKTAFKVMFALLEDWKNNDPDLPYVSKPINVFASLFTLL